MGGVIFECWHCQQGIVSELTGEPVMGEYFARPSLIQVKVQCPNCEQTAIRLTTGEVLKGNSDFFSLVAMMAHNLFKSDC